MPTAGTRRARAAQAGPGQARLGQTGTGIHPFDAGPAWMRIIPPAVMLAMALWRITGPSYWRDEAATMTATARPLGELLRMTGHVDAVHGAYYVLIWALVRLGGPGEFVTRLPSALAMAGAAAAVAALGRRLASPRAGLAAGLTFAVLPQVSLYAQDAREYAIVTALAATGSYLLVRALRAGGRRRGWLAGYAACLGVMGLLNVLSLLLVVAHAVTVALACRRSGSRATTRSVGLGWLAAAAGAVLVASPALAMGFAQRATLSWLTRPDPAVAAAGLRRLIGPAPMLFAVGLAVALGIFLSARAGRPALRAAWPPELLALAGPWLVLPPAVLIGVSQVASVYTFRYVLFCAPAAALLAGAGLAGLSERAAWAPAAACLAAVTVVGALGVPAQVAVRAPGGHGTDIRDANAIVAARRHPGDAVLYLGTDTKYFPAAYPRGFAALDDIAQRKTPSQAGNLAGTYVRGPVVGQRLEHVRRVWVVKLGDHPHHVLRGMGFRLLRSWRISDIWLLLFVRAQPGS